MRVEHKKIKERSSKAKRKEKRRYDYKKKGKRAGEHTSTRWDDEPNDSTNKQEMIKKEREKQKSHLQSWSSITAVLLKEFNKIRGH